MKKRFVLTAMLGKVALATVLALGIALVGCDNGSTGGGEEEVLEVTHVKGFQGELPDGSLIEIEVASTTDGEQNFTLYIDGEKKGTGTLTLSGGSITGIVSSTNESLTYSGGVRYSGISVSIQPADDKVWVHWGVYAGGTMNDFNTFAQQYNRDAYRMYNNRPYPDDEGFYSRDTPQNIYDQARLDHPSDAPPPSVLNQAIRVLNDHKNTGVGAYVSRGNLIAYYFKRVR